MIELSDIQLVSLIFTVVILMIMYVMLKTFRSKESFRYFPKIIQKISKIHMKSVLLPDAIDGSTYIDWLVLTPRGILVIVQKPYKGIIFSAENISHWTQVIDKRSYNFDNPLRQLELDVVTIKTMIPGVPVKGYVVFDRDSFFPKGKPKLVLTLNEVKQNISVFREGEISEKLLEAWKVLQSKLKESENDKMFHNMNASSNFS